MTEYSYTDNRFFKGLHDSGHHLHATHEYFVKWRPAEEKLIVLQKCAQYLHKTNTIWMRQILYP